MADIPKISQNGFLLSENVAVCAILFACSVLAGAGLFTLSITPHLRRTVAMYPLMLSGRMLQGIGSGSLKIVQDQIVAYWFKEKELASAFGIIMSFARLGSVINFLLTKNLQNILGMTPTFLFGTMTCLFSLILTILLMRLERAAIEELEDSGRHKKMEKKASFSDIKNVSSLYWLVNVTKLFFYNSVVQFVVDSTKFFQDKYNISPEHSAYTIGAVYDVGMVCSPFFGFLADYTKSVKQMMLAGSITLFPLYLLLAFTDLNPLVATIWLGLSFTMSVVSYWPIMTTIVPHNLLGLALGISTAITAIGVGTTSFVVGKILGHGAPASHNEILRRWRVTMIYLCANVLIAIIFAILFLVNGRKESKIPEVCDKVRPRSKSCMVVMDKNFNQIGTYNTFADDHRRAIRSKSCVVPSDKLDFPEVTFKPTERDRLLPS